MKCPDSYSDIMKQQYCGIQAHSDGGNLPFTGANIFAIVVLAIVLISIGIMLHGTRIENANA